MARKTESRLSERIGIWMHNESEAQKFSEENPHYIPKELKRK